MRDGKRCVIIGGAGIADYGLIRSQIKPDDYVIYCDSGLRHMEGLGVTPSLIVGDFDSHEDPHMDVETITLPVAKDDTDTVYAAKAGMERGYKEFLILGAIGERFDHSLVNAYMLIMLADRGCRGTVIDDYSEMELIRKGDTALVPDKYQFFSLVALEGPAKGVTIRGAKFCIDDAEISPSYQYATSNEVKPGMEARITLNEGSLLLIKDR